jgi:hypothetical protein
MVRVRWCGRVVIGDAHRSGVSVMRARPAGWSVVWTDGHAWVGTEAEACRLAAFRAAGIRP